jgi:hypothetical protein
MEHSSSRLERLFDLVESMRAPNNVLLVFHSVCNLDGTLVATRRAAAEQIGDVYAAHPDNLPSLLERVRFVVGWLLLIIPVVDFLRLSQC